MEAFKKQLNNRIIEWENIYGDYYNLMYNEDGSLKHFKYESELDQLSQGLHIANAVMDALNELKRNMYYNPKRTAKRKYKIEKLPIRTKVAEE